MPGRRILALAAAAATTLAASPATADTPGARRLAHAIVAHGPAPRPSAATCRTATRAERANAPFGRTRRPVYACTITDRRERARYIVVVLRNGCYVAERVRPGRAILGCGANRSA